MNNCCDVNYEDDRDYDYLIERLSHIEEEIQFIKKILEHKRIKEEAWEQLKQEAEYERAKDNDTCDCDCDCDCDECDTTIDVKQLVEDILKELEEKKDYTSTKTYTYRPPYWKYYVGDYPPYTLTTWF